MDELATETTTDQTTDEAPEEVTEPARRPGKAAASSGSSPVPNQALATRFLSVVVRPQSYLNLLYLLMAFPLGLLYFTFLVAGLSAGLGLLVVWVGVPMLALVLGIAWMIRQFERVLAVNMLDADVAPQEGEGPAGTDGMVLSTTEHRFVGAWRRTKAHLSNRLTWTGLLYLLLKFPLGSVSFVVTVTLVSITLGLLAAPVVYLVNGNAMTTWALDLSALEELISASGWDLSAVEDALSFSGSDIDSMWETLVFTLAGIPMVLVTLHLLNGAAFLSGRWARVMLGKRG